MSYVVKIGSGKVEKAILGGKGASLFYLAKAGFPVPDGFIITTKVYDLFLSHCGIQDLIKIGVSRQDIKDIIMSCEFPGNIVEIINRYYLSIGGGKVAVRSSATAEDMSISAFAGQFETFLNVEGIEQIVNAIKGCYASLFSERVLSYIRSSNVNEDVIKMAVVVQNMVDAQYSGVLFTANPINGRKDEMIINMVKGLGGSLVSDIRIPTQYVVREGFPQRILHMLVSKEGLLNRKALKDLISTGIQIERLYGVPQDIEWAWKDRLYILQSRPITARIMPYLDIGKLKGMFLKLIGEMIPYKPYPIDVDMIDLIIKEAVRPLIKFIGVRIPKVSGGLIKEIDGVPVFVDPYVYIPLLRVLPL